VSTPTYSLIRKPSSSGALVTINDRKDGKEDQEDASRTSSHGCGIFGWAGCWTGTGMEADAGSPGSALPRRPRILLIGKKVPGIGSSRTRSMEHPKNR
jgi:hypothetical protein